MALASAAAALFIKARTGADLQPRWSGGTYTMPHLETVAGEATDRSDTSNNILMRPASSLRRSPLGRHSVQLSSSTYICRQAASRTGVDIYAQVLPLAKYLSWKHCKLKTADIFMQLLDNPYTV